MSFIFCGVIISEKKDLVLFFSVNFWKYLLGFQKIEPSPFFKKCPKDRTKGLCCGKIFSYKFGMNIALVESVLTYAWEF